MLGFATPRAAFTAANACSKVWPFRHMRYAMTSVTLLDTPCEQWTNTRPACASASWHDAQSPSEQRAGSAAALHQHAWPQRHLDEVEDVKRDRQDVLRGRVCARRARSIRRSVLCCA